MSSFGSQYRPPAKPRRISEISKEDEQVRVVGFIVDDGESSLLLDDGSGRLNVVFDDPSLISDVEVGNKIRVFGTPLSIDDGFELHAEIVQEFDDLDLDLYKEVREKVRKLEKELYQ